MPDASHSRAPRPHPFLLAASLALMLLLWSANFLAGKIALRHMDVWTLVSFRIELAALLFLVIYFARSRRQRISYRDAALLGALGLFGVGLNQGCFTLGLNYTTAGHSSIIVANGPVLVLLLASALRLEKLTAGKLIGMGLAVAGVALLATEKAVDAHSPLLLGDLISLGGSIGFAIYSVYAKKVAGRFDSVAMNTYNCLAAALLLFPLAARQAAHLNWRAVGWQGWAAMSYMAAGSSVAAYLIYYWALRFMTASRVASVSYFQPLAVVLLSAVFLGEGVTWPLVAGGVCVLAGVWVIERSKT